MPHRHVAEHLRLIAQLMVIDGANQFRTRAFDEAADVIGAIATPIEEVDPLSLDGVGKSVGACVVQFLATGTSDRLQDLSSRWPATIMEMVRVNGIGPKTALK